MTDLHILVIGLFGVLAFAGYCPRVNGCADELAGDPGRPLAAAFVFIYLRGRCCAPRTLTMSTGDFLTLVTIALAILLVTPLLGRLYRPGDGGPADAS